MIRPTTKLPEGAWDCHLHIFPPNFPSVGSGPSVPPGTVALEDYRAVMDRLGIERALVVQPNAYQANNEALVSTLDALGDGARGVAAVAPGTPMAELERLHAAGVRGARIMDLGGGAVPLRQLPEVAAMISPLGWRLVVQFDGSAIREHEAMLSAIEGEWVLDHHGKFLSGIGEGDIETVKRLMDSGCVMKFAAPYEWSAAGEPGFEDVAEISRTFVAHRPDRVIWGSNWPHLLNAPGDKPDDAALLDTVAGWIPPEHHEAVFVTTPERLFGA